MLKDSKPPVTPPGSFVDENLWEYIARVLNLLYNLRVILESYSTGGMRTLFFFCFFFFSKEAASRR